MTYRLAYFIKKNKTLFFYKKKSSIFSLQDKKTLSWLEIVIMCIFYFFSMKKSHQQLVVYNKKVM
jgi:hypothetical protein